MVERVKLDLLNVGRLGALLALAYLEANPLILVQGAETRGFDGGVVHEQIRASIIGGDESETLFGVEPLDGALSHDDYLLFSSWIQMHCPFQARWQCFFLPAR